MRVTKLLTPPAARSPIAIGRAEVSVMAPAFGTKVHNNFVIWMLL